MPPNGVDISEFEKLSKPRRKPCAVGHAMESLDRAEAEQLRAAVAADQGVITNAAVEKWLLTRGYKTSAQAVSSHRKGTCRCGEDA